ncbi:MAG: hypothetical protein DRJ45_03315 [Thermoprotei archaeon]|nr:MAG: hypothetical protein DRJ45_03315 [Thermoprotei archaeon]
MMEERKDDIGRLVELLAEEKTWQGKMFGHEGQARVASAEIDYCERMLIDDEVKSDEEMRRYWELKREKARARRTNHLSMANEAREKLEEIRAEINRIMRRRGL